MDHACKMEWSSLLSKTEAHTCKTMQLTYVKEMHMSEQNNIHQSYNNNKKLDYNPLIEKVIPLYLISYNTWRG